MVWPFVPPGVLPVARISLRELLSTSLLSQHYNSASQVNAGNPNLKWEQTMQYDFGVDFSLLNNRLYRFIRLL